MWSERESRSMSHGQNDCSAQMWEAVDVPKIAEEDEVTATRNNIVVRFETRKDRGTVTHAARAVGEHAICLRCLTVLYCLRITSRQAHYMNVTLSTQTNPKAQVMTIGRTVFGRPA